jgi:hypothetical protein
MGPHAMTNIALVPVRPGWIQSRSLFVLLPGSFQTFSSSEVSTKPEEKLGGVGHLGSVASGGGVAECQRRRCSAGRQAAWLGTQGAAPSGGERRAPAKTTRTV